MTESARRQDAFRTAEDDPPILPVIAEQRQEIVIQFAKRRLPVNLQPSRIIGEDEIIGDRPGARPQRLFGKSCPDRREERTRGVEKLLAVEASPAKSHDN